MRSAAPRRTGRAIAPRITWTPRRRRRGLPGEHGLRTRSPDAARSATRAVLSNELPVAHWYFLQHLELVEQRCRLRRIDRFRLPGVLVPAMEDPCLVITGGGPRASGRACGRPAPDVVRLARSTGSECCAAAGPETRLRTSAATNPAEIVRFVPSVTSRWSGRAETRAEAGCSSARAADLAVRRSFLVPPRVIVLNSDIFLLRR